MTTTRTLSGPKWFVVQTLTNKENQVKRHLDRFRVSEEMEDFIFEVLMPTETVTEIKNGKKTQKTRKLYPGYVFLNMQLYGEDGKILQRPYYFVNGVDGVIGFVGGEKPSPLRDSEIERIINQVKEAEGREVPKVQFELGEEVRITDGPFLNLTGTIDEIDTEAQRLKVSVSIFGRFTPVDLQYWQVEKITD